jgi:hypothetical protein
MTAALAVEWHSTGVGMGYRYEGSPLIVPDGAPEPPDPHDHYAPTARPGHRAPHAWLADGRSTLDLFGKGFVLLRLGADPPDPAAMVQYARDCDVPLEVVLLADPEIAQLYERRLVLVRPDGMVAWRADEPPMSPAQVIDVVRGAARGGLR